MNHTNAYLVPCVTCGRPVYYRFKRCADCANTPPNLTTSGLRRLHEERGS